MTRSRLVLVPLAALAALAAGAVTRSLADDTTPRRDARASGPAAHATAGVALRSIGRFSSPIFVTSPRANAGRLFVVQQGGQIVVVRNGKRLAQPFLDISSKIVSGGEQGLLGLAFAPDYARSKLFYVYYTDRAGDERIVEYRAATADRADPASARVLLVQADDESNHNGGMIAFGPDRLLYAGLGDGGGGGDQHGARGNGQDLGTLLGKIIRIDPRQSGGKPYTTPSSNPFVGRSGARGEIYAYGLRNPWRFSFDRSTGDLTIGDVGQDNVEEIDFARRGTARGANYGWRVWEGRRRNAQEPASAAVFPVISKQHKDGYCSITGGYVVRDPSLPELRGRYVYGDFCEGHVRAATLRSGRATGDRQLSLPRIGSISSFGEDASGHVYVTSLDGPVYRLVSAP